MLRDWQHQRASINDSIICCGIVCLIMVPQSALSTIRLLHHTRQGEAYKPLPLIRKERKYLTKVSECW